MSTTVTYDVDCPDAAATEAFGHRLGTVLKGGEVIELAGDVGSGKTTFVRGLANGLGSSDSVSSPTYTISAVYKGRLTLYHLDLYRLTEPGLIRHQLSEIVQEPDAVTVIEWAGSAHDAMPDERIVIRFQVAAGEARRLSMLAPKSMEYVRCLF